MFHYAAKRMFSESGQSLVETALVLTIMLFMLLGLVNFGFIFQAYIVVVNAANVGADCAAGMDPFDAVQVQSNAMAEIDPGRCAAVSVSSPAPVSDGQGGMQVSVTVSCEVAHVVPMPSLLNPLVVSSTAVRKVSPW